MEELVCIKLNNGVKLPLLGAWPSLNKDSQTFGRILDGAFNAGYRHVQLDADHNDVTISSALKRWIPSTLQRDDIFVSVKIHVPNTRKVNIKSAVLQMLYTVGLDHLDCVILHFNQQSESAVPQNLSNLRDARNHVDHRIQAVDVITKLMEEDKVRCWGLVYSDVHHLDTFLKKISSTPQIIQNSLPYNHPGFQHMRKYCRYKNMQLLVDIADINSPSSPESSELRKALHISSLQLQKSPNQVLVRALLSSGCASLCSCGSEEEATTNFQVLDFGLSNSDIHSLAAAGK